MVALFSTLLALGLGVVIAYSSAKSISQPLHNLMVVTHQIGTAGDLNHEIDFKRDDEIGELGRTFYTTVNYLKEMATLSEEIAGEI